MSCGIQQSRCNHVRPDCQCGQVVSSRGINHTGCLHIADFDTEPHLSCPFLSAHHLGYVPVLLQLLLTPTCRPTWSRSPLSSCRRQWWRGTSWASPTPLWQQQQCGSVRCCHTWLLSSLRLRQQRERLVKRDLGNTPGAAHFTETCAVLTVLGCRALQLRSVCRQRGDVWQQIVGNWMQRLDSACVCVCGWGVVPTAACVGRFACLC